MFFFIGGMQPKTVILDDVKRLCPFCGLAQARLKRVDQYLSLFFIPLLRVKQGNPVLICDRCGAVSDPEGSNRLSAKAAPHGSQCRWCGEGIEPGFNYCPHCGREV